MLKKIAMVFTIALSLLAFCLPVTSSAVQLSTSSDVEFSNPSYYLKTFTKFDIELRYIPVPYDFYSVTGDADVDWFIVRQGDYIYAVFYQDARPVVDASQRKITVLAENNGGTPRYIYAASRVDVNQIASNWTISEQSLPQSINYEAVDGFFATTKNLYDSDNNQVFPLTPWAVAMRELKTVAVPRVLGEMKIVTLSGVGCLALLIGLVVFFKVFQKFQVK